MHVHMQTQGIADLTSQMSTRKSPVILVDCNRGFQATHFADNLHPNKVRSIYIYIYINMYVLYTYIHAYIHAYIHTHVYIYVYTYMHIYIYVCLCWCVYVYICMQGIALFAHELQSKVYIHTYIHTYIQVFWYTSLQDGAEFMAKRFADKLLPLLS